MKRYENPVLEIKKFNITDVISTSADDYVIKDDETSGSKDVGGL